MPYEYAFSFASEIITLAVGLGMAAFVWGIVYFLYRIIMPCIVREDILEAYKIKRLKEEMKKRNIDMETMLQEHKEIKAMLNKISFKRSKKGTLDKIDEHIMGELGELDNASKKTKGE